MFHTGTDSAAGSNSYVPPPDEEGATGHNGMATNGVAPSSTAHSNGVLHPTNNGSACAMMGEEEEGEEAAWEATSRSTFTPLYEGSPLDRREFLRLTLQSLRELGFE